MPKSFDKTVRATITKIGVEVSSLSNWWMITAEWRDPRNGAIFTFRGPRMKYAPSLHEGEEVTVYFDSAKPSHYRMDI